MATRFTVLHCEQAEPEDRVYLRLDDRHGDTFEVELSEDEARRLSTELFQAVEMGTHEG